MAEENEHVMHSQESLPLSQETYASLMNLVAHFEIPNLQVSSFDDSTNEYIPQNAEYISAMEQGQELSTNNPVLQPMTDRPNSLNVYRTPSSLPASENWPGDYLFDVSFYAQESVSKKSPWAYSAIKDKLFVHRDAPCPFNISTNAIMSSDVSIRAMVLFNCAEHASEVVQRCVNHSMEEIKSGVFEAEHLVRCESYWARYEVDARTKRHSVVVPFENHAEGQQFPTYKYKFMCFSSCSGGPNRRPMFLLFTLERGSEVIGRRRINLKICACPTRDKNTEEQHKKESTLQTKHKASEDTNNQFIDGPPLKKSKHENKTRLPYILEVEDYECYQFLKQMKVKFEMHRILKSFFSMA